MAMGCGKPRDSSGERTSDNSLTFCTLHDYSEFNGNHTVEAKTHGAKGGKKKKTTKAKEEDAAPAAAPAPKVDAPAPKHAPSAAPTMAPSSDDYGRWCKYQDYLASSGGGAAAAAPAASAPQPPLQQQPQQPPANVGAAVRQNYFAMVQGARAGTSQPGMSPYPYSALQGSNRGLSPNGPTTDGKITPAFPASTGSPLSPMYSQPPFSQRLALGNGDAHWIYGEAIVDPGAATCVTSSTLIEKGFLKGRIASNTKISGVSGAQIGSRGIGTASTVFISPDGDLPHLNPLQAPHYHETEWECLDDVPTLFSTNRMLREEGWSMLPKMNGMTRNGKIIPFEYCPSINLFLVRFIISEHPRTAYNVGCNLNDTVQAGRKWQWWKEGSPCGQFLTTPKLAETANNIISSTATRSMQDACIPVSLIMAKIQAQDEGHVDGIHVRHRDERDDPPDFKFDIFVDTGVASVAALAGSASPVSVTKCIDGDHGAEVWHDIELLHEQTALTLVANQIMHDLRKHHPRANTKTQGCALTCCTDSFTGITERRDAPPTPPREDTCSPCAPSRCMHASERSSAGRSTERQVTFPGLKLGDIKSGSIEIASEHLRKTYDHPDGILHDMTPELRGTKAGMNSREKKMTAQALHRKCGHPGGVEGCDCTVCRMIRGSMRRVFTKVDPFVVTIPGVYFVGDVITFNCRSLEGNKYAAFLRDIGSGWRSEFMWLEYRDDVIGALDDTITKLRTDPLFQNLGRPVMQWLRLDLDGPWLPNASKFVELADKHAFHFDHVSPDKTPHPYGAAHAEVAVLQSERHIASMLLDRALPATWFQRCGDAHVFVTNRLPISSNVKSRDGDAIRPMQEITGFMYSLRMCNNDLHHFEMPGTLCLVYDPKVKGSNLIDLKGRWGVIVRMEGDIPEFECPFNGARFRSKNYYVHELPAQWAYWFALGLPEPTFSAPRRKRGRIEPPAGSRDTIIFLKNFTDWVREDKTDFPEQPGSITYRNVNPPSAITIIDPVNNKAFTHNRAGDIVPITDVLPDGIIHANGTPSPLHSLPHDTVTAARAAAEAERAKRAAEAAGAPEPNVIPAPETDMTRQILLRDTVRPLPPPRTELTEYDMLYTDPAHFSGKHFMQHFDDKLGGNTYEGVITHHDTTEEGTLWHVRYPADGKTATFDEHDVAHYVLKGKTHPPSAADRIPGAPAPPPRPHAEPPDVHPPSHLRGGVPPPPAPPPPDHGRCPTLRGPRDTVNIVHKRDVSWKRAHLKSIDHPVVPVGVRTSWRSFIDQLGLPRHHERLYYNWLGPDFGINADYNPPRGELGCKFSPPWAGGRKNVSLRQGAEFPAPQGESWLQWTQAYDRAQRESNSATANAALVSTACESAYVAAYINHAEATDRLHGVFTAVSEHPGEPMTQRDLDIERELRETRHDASIEHLFLAQIDLMKEQEATKDAETPPADLVIASFPDGTITPEGKLIEPSDYNEAKTLPCADLWTKAYQTEVANITGRQVLHEDFMTLEQCYAEGVRTRPVPMRNLFSVKTHPDGSFDKLKVRTVVLGHPGYMRKGQHFWATYSASPFLVTPRLIQILVVQLGWCRMVYDIVAAYLWADCLPEERIIIDLPPGMDKLDKDGNKLFKILMKTCYGCPFSDRRYCILRNDFIMKEFNKDGWCAYQSSFDACLFTLTHIVTKAGSSSPSKNRGAQGARSHGQLHHQDVIGRGARRRGGPALQRHHAQGRQQQRHRRGGMLHLHGRR